MMSDEHRPSIFNSFWLYISHGQTLFRTEGRGLGHGHRAVCRSTPWSVDQSQCGIQSRDTWTGKFKISAWVESELEAWEVNWARIVLRHELEHHQNRNHECRKVASLTLAIAIADVMTRLHDYLNSWATSCSMACPRPLPYVWNGVWPRDYWLYCTGGRAVWYSAATIYYYMPNAGCQGWQTQMRVIFSLAPPSNAKYGE